MKKIFSVLAVLSGLLAAGCMEDVITETNEKGSDYIGFSTSTTRATVSDIASMQGDGTGFKVYATSGSAPSGWYSDGHGNRINGTNHHRWDGDKWRFTQQVKWPGTDGGYPMNFYALYPADPAGLGHVSEGFSPVTLGVPYTVQPAIAQIDLLAARATANYKPLSSLLQMTFKHILSKIGFGITTGEGVDVQVLSIDVVNVGDTRTYDLVAGQWTGAATGSASYGYSLGAQNNHLMLMPQTRPGWNPVRGSAPTAASGGYVCVTYRMSTGNGTTGNGDPREVGFADAAQYPGGSGGVAGPLFVKAGFPLASGDFVWDAGKSYTYNLGLGTPGSCNGHILDEYYYNAGGNRTNLKLVEVANEGKRVGDKLKDGTIRVKLTVDDWGPGGGNIEPITPILSIDRSSLSFRHSDVAGVTQEIAVTANNPWNYSVSGNNTGDFNVSRSGDRLYVSTKSANSAAGSPPRTMDITFTAGGLTETAVVLQHGTRVESGTSVNTRASAVGAFWRWSQKGERLIQINVSGFSGSWMVAVSEYGAGWDPAGGDGIVFAGGDSQGMTMVPDPADPNKLKPVWDQNAELYPITNGAASVGGTVGANGIITFRIGLQKSFPGYDNATVESTTPRYAKVELWYGGMQKVQYLYLRQGEGPDFILPYIQYQRNNAKRFSPYNLTAPTAIPPLGMQVNTNGGTFVDYPTKVGAIFQWGTNGNVRYAFNPFDPAGTTGVSGWNTSFIEEWDPNYETCPTGYRRPKDSYTAFSTNGGTGSEMRESLWKTIPLDQNTNETSSIYGYYADGYYDRHYVDKSNLAASGIVGAGTAGIATIGRLFFNADNLASVFFPASGYRYNNNGEYYSTGYTGYYWTSTMYKNTSIPGVKPSSAWLLNLRDVEGGTETHTGMVFTSPASGGSIRCVK